MMSEIVMGIVASVIGAILLGSYFTPLKFSKLNVNQYLLVMFIFSTLSMMVIFFYYKEPINFKLQDIYFPAISGILFSIAIALVFFSIKTIGISKAGAIYIGLQLVVASIIGIAFFNELGPLSFYQ